MTSGGFLGRGCCWQNQGQKAESIEGRAISKSVAGNIAGDSVTWARACLLKMAFLSLGIH